jgi:hypothetical protein
MPRFFQSKFIRFGGVGLLLIIVLTVLWGATNLMTSSTGLSSDSYNDARYPSAAGGFASGKMMQEESVAADSVYYPPQPNTGNYTSDLETYETTSYLVTARTKQFDEVCSAIKNLKNDSAIHFKNLNESTNNCRATFYAEINQAKNVLTTLTAFNGVEYSRDTQSVTRHRQQIQSQTSILQQQLSNVQRSLTTAETQLNNLTDFYLTSDDVSNLTLRVNESLRLIDQLNQRKINLTSQLNNLYQQSADLEQRLGVVEFSVNINRSSPIFVNKDSQKWERAWEDMSDTYTNTLIGLSAFFGIFLLWVLRISIYLIVVTILLRGLTKFVKLIWSKW